MSRYMRVLAALVGAALALTGCSGGEDGDDAATTEDAVEAAPTAEEDAAAEEATATDEEEPTAATEATDPAAEETEGGTAGGEVAIGEGITEEPCPDATNPDNGCIYLGQLSDLTVGPFAAQGPQIVAATNAFWQRVNDDGGIAGYDVDSSTNVRDHQYSPETASEAFAEINDDILAVTHMLGSPIGIALEPLLEQESMLAIPGTWTSEWLFSPTILESGSTYCVDAMNSVDYEVANGAELSTVMAIHYPGDFGDDAAAGMAAAAEANGLEFIDVPTQPGPDNQGEAIGRLTSESPDMVLLAVAPADLGAIVGAAASQGYEGLIHAQGPGFNEGLLDSPVADIISERVTYGVPWSTLASDAPGMQAFRDAMGEEASTTGLSGWVWSYPLLEVLRAAADAGDLTRDGLLAAAEGITSVDYEGILPEGSGNISGEPNDAAIRVTTFARLDGEADTRVEEFETGFGGPTAEAYEFDAACYA